MREGSRTVTAKVIPFPDATRRPARGAPAADEIRGEILIFTGVRYERLAEPNPEPTPAVPQGPRRRRRG